MARQQARRHHRERVAGIALAVLGAIVLVVALFALHQPAGHNAADSASATVTRSTTISRTPSATRSPSTKPASASGPSLNLDSSGASSSAGAKAVPLVVLNNSTIFGLAKQAAQRFRDGGWKVTDTGNLQNTIISTCAYYDASVASAKSAAEALQQQYPTIKRVQPKFAELPSGPVVVVLTSDYSSG